MEDLKFKLVLCDLGNVLLCFDHRIAVRKIQSFTDKSFDEIYQFFFDSELTGDFEEGKISPLDFFKRVNERLKFRNLTFQEFVPIWSEIFFENDGMLELLSTLKERYRLHLISNINELHYNYIAQKFPRHIAVFDKVYLSHVVGHRKPDAEIYHKAIGEDGFKPAEVIYTDDRPDLIQEASRLGLKAILFKSVASLREELMKLKALP